jgi:hypothetical protein
MVLPHLVLSCWVRRDPAALGTGSSGMAAHLAYGVGLSPLCPWVVALIRLLEMLGSYICINLRGGESPMPQEACNVHNVCPTVQEVGGEAVAYGMGWDPAG